MLVTGEIERKLRILAEKTHQSVESALTALVNEKYAEVVENADDDFARMANDPDIRRELARINFEFAETEADGLDI